MRRNLATLLLSIILTLALVTTTAAAVASAPEGTPILRMNLEPRGPVDLGIDLTLHVEVLVPTWFLDAPRFPETFELPGATVELIRGSAQNLSETVGGSTWAGLRRDYRIQPLNPGKFQLPSLVVAITYARAGGKGPRTLTVRGQAGSSVTVTVPEAAARLDPFIAAHRLRVSQRVERPTEALGAGDAVRRSIVIESDAATAELPAAAWPQAPGARLYLDPPRSRESRVNAAARPLLTREQSGTWIFEQPGQYQLPAVTLDWWDLSGRQLRRSQLPAVPLTVGPAGATAVFALPEAVTAPAPGPAWPSRRAVALALALAAGMGLWLAWRSRRLGQRAVSWLGALGQAWERSEWWLFRRLVGACRRHDAGAAQAALHAWLNNCAAPQPGLNQWLLDRTPSPELAAALANLASTLYGVNPTGPWRGTALAGQLSLARRHLPRCRPTPTNALPTTLNP